MTNERELKIQCPEDGSMAIITKTEDGFDCSHSCQISHCPSRCAARAVMCEPEKSTRLQIVCPETYDLARVIVKDDQVVWCSNEAQAENCEHQCLKCKN